MNIEPLQIHQWLLIAYAVMSVLVFLTVQFVAKASYGRHDTDQRAWWWGPGLPTRWSWIIMEAPSSLGFAAIYFAGERALDLVPLLLFLMWQAHYFHRSFIYPFTRKLKPGETTPSLIPFSGLVTNLGVSFLNAAILSWVAVRADYGIEWLTDPRFIIGLMIFCSGFYINRKADAMLAALRKPGETGYKIPQGWLYEKVSCPNYLGEMTIWLGWAIATWSWAGAVFLLWTIANLLPRALANHAWYHEKFEGYPSSRKAIIPGML